MKLLGGLLTLLMALVISVVAGYFSVIGLGHLFAGAFWPVIVMGAALEAGKLVAATWLKANWSNPKVGWLHKAYLTLAVIVLMLITSLGIYGYLAKGHLEQEAPLASVELQITQIETKVAQAAQERSRLEDRLKQLDQTAGVLLEKTKTAREAQAANRALTAQRKDRADITTAIAAKDAEINTLTESLVPLKLQVSDVSAKLGPLKYVANLFGWADPQSAVNLVILLIIFAFDPLAVAMVLSGTITFFQYFEERRQKQKQPELAALMDQWIKEDAKVPNAETQAAIADAEAGRTERFNTVDELLADAEKPEECALKPFDIATAYTGTFLPNWRDYVVKPGQGQDSGHPAFDLPYDTPGASNYQPNAAQYAARLEAEKTPQEEENIADKEEVRSDTDVEAKPPESWLSR